jgi:hypothetical protein
MTTIAYRAGICAADTLAQIGSTSLGSVTKIVRSASGDLAGAAGLASYAEAFRHWVTGGENGDPPQARETDHVFDRGVIFRRSGEIVVFEPEGRFSVAAPYYAFGSGKEIAIGAMFMGATAPQAIEAAIKHDDGTGGEITVLRHDAADGIS